MTPDMNLENDAERINLDGYSVSMEAVGLVSAMLIDMRRASADPNWCGCQPLVSHDTSVSDRQNERTNQCSLPVPLTPSLLCGCLLCPIVNGG